MDPRRPYGNGLASAQSPPSRGGGAMDYTARPDPLRPAQSGVAQGMSRAQKFDDEKRRIVESCFGKNDESGRPLQNYITHIRVEEDGMYPTGPPPPDAAPQYKKSRVIIIAVKNTGRVWVHKARENADGTFQIGKSWAMEDLTAIEVFPPIQQGLSPEALQRAQWAGSLGFIVTIGKPYYWAAHTAKEKDFFVASLIKIYKKYTAGKVPQLIGLAPALMSEIVGAPPDQAASQVFTPPQPQFANQPSSRGQSPASRVPGPPQDPAQMMPISPERVSQPLQTGSPSQRPPSPLRHRNITPLSDYGRPSTAQSNTYSRDTSAHRPPPSRDGMSPPMRSHQPQDSAFRRPPTAEPLQPPPRLRPDNADQSAGVTPRSSVPNLSDAGSLMGERRGPGPIYNDSQGGPNGHGSRDVYATPPESVASRSMTSLSESASEVGSHAMPPQAPPQRRRPPLQEYQRGRADTLTGPNPALASRSSNQDLRPSPLGASHPVTAVPQTTSPDPTPAPLQPKAPLTSPNGSQDMSVTDQGRLQQHRPGLGPMTGKTHAEETANKMRKAATAAGAFKPRAGGAGARLLANKNKRPEDEAPLNEVIPAPSVSRIDSIQQTPVDKIADQSALAAVVPEPVPAVKVSAPAPAPVPQPDAPVAITTKDAVGLGIQGNDTVEAPQAESAPEAVKKPRSSKYDAALGKLDIDPDLLGTRQREYDTVLTDFGWETSILSGKKADALETNLRREIARLEAGSWLGHSDQKDDRVDLVQKMLDKAIAECDEMEGLLTLYGVELGTLNADVSYIEAQSHGLQVQTANQKALQTKLHDLVDTVSINTSQLEPLRRASISDMQGLESVEICLVQLYEAMATIDPSMFRGKNSSSRDNDSFNTMRSLQERKDVYLTEVYTFLDRLRQYMDPTFATAFKKTTDMVNRNSSTSKGSTNLDVASHDLARTILWQYSPLMLFVKGIEVSAWDAIMQIYNNRAGAVYRTEFRDNIAAWKKTARKPSGAEQQALFTAQELEKSDGMIRSAQKLTVKRSQMLARGLRTGTFEKKTKMDKDPNAKFDPFETLAGALDEMLPIMTCEQNFVVDFFHASSSDAMDFPETVASGPPSERRGTNLFARKPMEPDRDMANRVLRTMESIYGSWPAEMQSFIDWAIAGNELQAVGILCAIERSLLILSDTSQEFITRTLQKLHERVSQLFLRTVDAQIRAIEDTKVKIKKRKGVITFMRVFPNFSAIVESMLPPAESPEGQLEIRAMVDAAYTRISKTMFDSLKVIAKESPTAGTSTATTSTDPDDKEALNYHILLIENMHHYAEEVLEHGDAVLGEWRGKALMEMAEHQEAYVGAVIRRPLGKLLDFVESVESILSSSPAARATPTAIPTTHPSHSRSIFKKVLAANTGRDVRKGVDALRLRVEKHFGDGDEPALAQRLVMRIMEDCERRYGDVAERTRRIAQDVYEGSVEVEFTKGDVQAAFRR